jgi:hypothetical protein
VENSWQYLKHEIRVKSLKMYSIINAFDDDDHARTKAKSKAIVRQKKNLFMGPKGVPDTKTDRPTDRRS